MKLEDLPICGNVSGERQLYQDCELTMDLLIAVKVSNYRRSLRSIIFVVGGKDHTHNFVGQIFFPLCQEYD